MKPRSLLYMPADNDAFIAKAHQRHADAIILDLEDSVRPENKTEARNNLGKSVMLCKQSGARVFVRINADHKTALLDALAALKCDVDGIYVPKAHIKRIRALSKSLKPHEQRLEIAPLPFVALIEDPKGVLQAKKIARCRRVIGLTIGAEDLANALNASADPDVMIFPKQFVHFHAKAYGKMSFGLNRSVADYRDLTAIKAAAQDAKRFGFDGASCVHPSVVSILNDAFSYSPSELDWARQIIKASENSTFSAFVFQGKMVDTPILNRAKMIIADTDGAAGKSIGIN